jgi:hypothetical protein
VQRGVTALRHCIAYADDILITARTKQAGVDTFEKLKNQSLKVVLVINQKKDKYLRFEKGNYQMDDLRASDMRLEQIHSYKYLVSIISRDNSTEEEISE